MRKISLLAVWLVMVAPTVLAATMKYSGEAVIRSLSPTRVAVLVDTNGDRTIDQGFLLTMDVPLHHGISVHLPKAGVEMTDGYVRVTSDKKVFDLEVAGYPDPPPPPADAEVVTFFGSALVHSTGDSGCDLDRAQTKDAGACYAYGKD